MKLREKFHLLSRGKQIAVVVCSLHLMAVFGLLGNHLFSKRMRAPRPIAVRTVVPQGAVKTYEVAPKAQVAAPVVKKEAPKKEVAKKVVAPKPVAAVAAKVPVKGKAAPLPTPKKIPLEKDEGLLKEIASQLEAFNSASSKQKVVLPVPSKVESKAPVKAEVVVGPTYGEFLIGYFQENLDLPEHGEVKAKIEIDRFGQLIDVQILEAKSSKNAEFLKNRLPELSFPCLNDFDIYETAQTFTITFRNAEIR